MAKSAPCKGYTLIELLVVITIIGIISLVGFINLRSFEEDKQLVSAAADLQNFLRLAQTNATTAVKCGTEKGATWFVAFKGKTDLELSCRPGKVLSKPLSFDAKIEISSIEGTSICSTYPVNITYSPLYGQVEFEDASGCVSRSPKVKVTLKNSNNKTNQTKVVTINKVGTVNVE